MRNKIIHSLVLVNLFLTLSLCVIDRVNAQVAAPSGYSLIGTIQSADFSGAVISVTKGEQTFFRLFDMLPDGSQIIAIRPDTIMLKGTNGLTYEMFILHETRNVASVLPDIPAEPSNEPLGEGRSVGRRAGQNAEPKPPRVQGQRERRPRASHEDDE